MSLQRDLLTGAPENNTITITRTCGDEQFSTEIYLANKSIGSTRVTGMTTVAIDSTLQEIVREQQEMARAILELLTGR